MITVRFPSGFSVQYNTLDTADIRTNGTYLSRKSEPDSYSVWCPAECIIEHISPCRTYNASGEPDEVKQEIYALRKEIRSLTRKVNQKA